MSCPVLIPPVVGGGDAEGNVREGTGEEEAAGVFLPATGSAVVVVVCCLSVCPTAVFVELLGSSIFFSMELSSCGRHCM